MNFVFGILLIAAGILLVRFAMPKNGVPRALLRSGGFIEFIYLMFCLGVLMLGIGFVAAGFRGVL